MKKYFVKIMLILSGGLLLLSACGGGGGGGGTTVTQPTTAVLTMSAAVTGSLPADSIINGYKVTVDLPAGVTVKASPDSGNPAIMLTDSGVVTAVGAAAGSLVSGIYSPATNSLPATVEIVVAKATDLGQGAFATITCDIAAGTYPKASDFPQPTFEATGLVTVPTNSTVDLTSQMALTITAVIN